MIWLTGSPIPLTASRPAPASVFGSRPSPRRRRAGDDDDPVNDEAFFAGLEDYSGAIEAYGARQADGEDGTGQADAAGPAFQLVLQLRSNADPSLIVDAAALWSQPETVLSRFGPQAETDLLLALRRGAAIWPPLAGALEQASPSVIDLDDDALASLLGPAAEELAGAGIEVLWPSSLLDGGLKLEPSLSRHRGR